MVGLDIPPLLDTIERFLLDELLPCLRPIWLLLECVKVIASVNTTIANSTLPYDSVPLDSDWQLLHRQSGVILAGWVFEEGVNFSRFSRRFSASKTASLKMNGITCGWNSGGSEMLFANKYIKYACTNLCRALQYKRRANYNETHVLFPLNNTAIMHTELLKCSYFLCRLDVEVAWKM